MKTEGLIDFAKENKDEITRRANGIARGYIAVTATNGGNITSVSPNWQPFSEHLSFPAGCDSDTFAGIIAYERFQLELARERCAMKDGIFEISISVGASNALRENSEKLNDEILEKAEELAIARSQEDGYPPTLLRRDIEGAIEEVGNGKRN